MMRWFTGVLQVVVPMLSGWHFLRAVYRPWMAFRPEESVNSWGGFYGPLAMNFLCCLAGISATFAVPHWKFLMGRIRELLPASDEELQIHGLAKLIREAFREKRENGIRESRNLAAQLRGDEAREKVDVIAMESLQLELQRILNELRGGG